MKNERTIHLVLPKFCLVFLAFTLSSLSLSVEIPHTFVTVFGLLIGQLRALIFVWATMTHFTYGETY